MDITINDKTYTATTPKAKIWREIMKFDEERTTLPNADFIDAHAIMIAKAFPDLTSEEIIEQVDIDDIVPMYFDVFKWICGLLNNKLKQIPNVETPVEE